MIKNWNLFKESVDEESKIVELCDKYKIENYTINDDSSIDVDDNIFLPFKNLKEIPLKFGRVSGYFYCSSNDLSSLYNSPKWVGYNFFCHSNKLTSLEYLPNWIGGYIDCQYNKIWSFRGIPDSFRGELICNNNPIYNIWKLFESSGDIEFFNDCDIIREPETPDGKPIVVIERLNFFLETIGKPTVKGVDGYINI
jgi:hypothetical protein